MNPDFPASSALPPHLRAGLGAARLRASWQDDGLLRALGVGEPMPAGLVRRLGGTSELFLAAFHQPVRVRLSGGHAEVPANSLLVWRPGMAQEYGRAQAAWLHSWLLLRDPGVVLAEAAGLPCDQPIPLPGLGPFEVALEELHAERRRPRPDAVVIEALATVLLRRLARCAPPAEDGLAAVHRRIRERPEERQRLDALAALAGCSVPHLVRGFRARYGCAPVAFAIDVRLRHAARLIRGGAAVAEAARRCGWADARQFARVFRARLGATPAAWRDG